MDLPYCQMSQFHQGTLQESHHVLKCRYHNGEDAHLEPETLLYCSKAVDSCSFPQSIALLLTLDVVTQIRGISPCIGAKKKCTRQCTVYQTTECDLQLSKVCLKYTQSHFTQVYSSVYCA